MGNKLNTKDLINAGIFTAIYFVVFFACGMLGFIPVLMLLIPVICPIVAGIPFMLYLTKVKKFGMVTITGIICGILMVATGHSFYPLVTGIVFGLLSDLILKSGGYKSISRTILGYGVYSIWLIGMLVPFFIMTDSFREGMIAGYGHEYTNALTQILQPWIVGFLHVASFLGGVFGALLGRSVLKKHFQKAGIV